MSTQIAIKYRDIVQLPAVATPAWFAVHTSARHEKQVALQLTGRGIEHLLPLYDEVHRWADRRVIVQMPLFPGYLFVRIVAGQRRDVVQVPGVSRIVGFTAGPVPLQDAEIVALRNGLAAGIKLEPHPYLTVGCRVRVRTGALRGLQGLLVRRKEGDRIVVSVDLIMRSVAMEIDGTDLEVIE